MSTAGTEAGQLLGILVRIAIGVLIVVSFWQFFGRYIYNYRLAEKSIQIVIARLIPVMRIRYIDITEIQEFEINWKEALIGPFRSMLRLQFALGLGNRPFGPAARIRKRSGLLVFLTPDDTSEFVKRVRAKIGGMNGTN